MYVLLSLSCWWHLLKSCHLLLTFLIAAEKWSLGGKIFHQHFVVFPFSRYVHEKLDDEVVKEP